MCLTNKPSLNLKEQIHSNHDDLVILIKNKNQKAFTYLYDNYAKALFIVSYSIVKNVEEAEDILQKVFLKIWDNFDSFDSSKGTLYTWMLKLTRNMAIDYTRSKEYKIKIQNVTKNVNDFVVTAVEEELTNTTGLKKAIGQLKSQHAILIDMAYYKGYTQEEISTALNIPIGTVKTRIRKAILIMRTNLQEKTHLYNNE